MSNSNGKKNVADEFALEEYKSLRQESLEAIAQQGRAFQLGIVALGALLGLGLRITKSSDAAGPIALAVAGPTLAGCVYIQWQEQQLRGYRTGVYLRVRERLLERQHGSTPRPLVWERWLQFLREHERRREDQSARASRWKWLRALRDTGRTWINHWSVMFALLLSGLASSAVGLATLVDHHHATASIVTGVLDLIVVGAMVRYASGLRPRLNQLDKLGDEKELLAE